VRRAAARLLCVLLSTLAGLWFASWAAGRWLPLPALLFRLDDELLYAPIPGARRVLPLAAGSGGAWITTEFDEQGFRGSGIAAKKSAPRVLVLGDSLVMAETSRLEDSYCVRLAQHIGGEVEVVNAGVLGFGPDQECLLLERLLAPLDPDLVVLVLCAHNDFGDLVRDKLFRLDTREALVRNHPRLDPALLARWRTAEQGAGKPALLRAVERLGSRGAQPPADAGASDYIDMYLRRAQQEYSEFVEERDDLVRNLFDDSYDADVAIRPEQPSSLFKKRLMKGLLARVRDECAGRGARLLALVVPSSVDLCPGYGIHVDPARYPGWSPTGLTDAYTTILADLEVSFLDLTPAFRAAGAESLYMGRGDFHWNGAGQELGAQRTAACVRERALLAPRR